MQYPQIQFYKGSLVRLASGKLKRVEDLDSEDFLESAKLTQLTTSDSHSTFGFSLSSVVRDFLELTPTPIPQASGSTGNLNGNPLGLSIAFQQPTVLIKFFLESSRSIVFTEVPTDHPFFVLHRGWSSWNPQRTYEKFGLKCRKLKIGDTCISLIRRRPKRTDQQQESDQCNIMFSSIKIHE